MLLSEFCIMFVVPMARIALFNCYCMLTVPADIDAKAYFNL